MGDLGALRGQLRGYQVRTVDQAEEALAQSISPVLALPTGSGKSLIAAYLMKSWADRHQPPRVVCLSHSKEIIEQNYRAYSSKLGDHESGVYCAGLGRKELGAPVLFASIQSLANAPGLDDVGLVVIDEAHRIPFAEESQYRSVLRQWPEAMRVGLSATPYRLDGGRLDDAGPEGEPPLFDETLETVGIQELVSKGFLSPLTGVQSLGEIDTQGVRKRLGDFVASEVEQVATQEGKSEEVSKQLAQHVDADGRKHVLVFAVGIDHAEELQSALAKYGRANVVHSKLSEAERSSAIEGFRRGEAKYLVNVGVLTTGFDFPAVDCVAVVRPTESKPLFVQMIGRGCRIEEGKRDCRILDFGGNLRRHAPLEEVPEYTDEPKEAAEAEARKDSGTKQRQDHQFALDKDAEIWWRERGQELVEFSVFDIDIRTVKNSKDPNIRQLKVTYKTDKGPVIIYLLPEHSNKARFYSNKWFRRRGAEMPRTAKDSASLARRLDRPKSIHAVKDGKFWRVTIEHFPEQ